LSANVAVIYVDSGTVLREVARSVGEAAQSLSAHVRLLRIDEHRRADGAPHGDGGGTADPEATTADLEWADGIAFGTPARADEPSPALMGFIERTEPLWASARLYDKVVTTFTDEPQEFDPDAVVHPIYEALYHWGAVIVGPRAYELELDARPTRQDRDSGGPLSGPRMRTARYRGRRITAIAGVLAAERGRQARLEM
jgi:NAD(P)H dehydrogenase (quinone)